jgi:hypothetical protein
MGDGQRVNTRPAFLILNGKEQGRSLDPSSCPDTASRCQR